MTRIKGNLDWNTQDVVPAFVQGKDAKAMYDATDGIRTGTIVYEEKTRTMYGSTPFLSARIDTLIRPLGLHVANLRDLSRPEIMKMIKGNYYSDAPALVLRSMQDFYA